MVVRSARMCWKEKINDAEPCHAKYARLQRKAHSRGKPMCLPSMKQGHFSKNYTIEIIMPLRGLGTESGETPKAED